MTTPDFSEPITDGLADLGVPLGPGSIIVELAGGVSATTLAVTRGERSVVVKTALNRLRVQSEWTAPTSRIISEARAMQLVASIEPDAVPKILLVDEKSSTIVMSRIDVDYENWKTRILEGSVTDPSLPVTLGRKLAQVHSSTASTVLDDSFDDKDVFYQLRIEPFYEAAARQLPSSKRMILDYAHELMTPGTVLVHGDFSPKNLLVFGSDVVILDWEVAHRGNPVFDLAFMLSHLVAKGIHLPDGSAEPKTIARSFLEAYSEKASELASFTQPDQQSLLGHTACILLGRILGRSPLTYLTSNERTAIRTIALEVLDHRIHTTDELWEAVSAHRFANH